MQKLVRWGSVSILLGVLVWVIVSWVLAYRQSADQATGNLKLPDDYYSLRIIQRDVVVCFGGTTNDDRVGNASKYFAVDKNNIRHLIVIYSKATLTRKDIEDYEKRLPGQYVNLILSLEPEVLFHVWAVDKEKKIYHVAIFTRSEVTWSESLKFWRPRFEKEWEKAMETNYQYDQAEAIERPLMQKFVDVNGKSGNCELIPTQ